MLTVQSGDTVTVETRDVSDNQLSPSSTSKDIETIDWDRVYPLAGPIAVEGAGPGDTLAVEILELRVKEWGWTAIIPGFGLLPDEFPSAYLRIFDLTNGEHAFLREDVAIPIEPFFGTMGVCPSGATNKAVMPPGTFGGNLDTRQLVQGATLYLPVEVDGALFSCGDAHAAQGDGEVCVTGIETPIGATLRFTLEQGRQLPAPQFRTPGPAVARADRGEWYGTTGVGPDLYVAAQDAVRAMIDHVSGDDRALGGGRVRAREPVRRPQDLRDRRRRRVRRQRAPPPRRARAAVGAGPPGHTAGRAGPLALERMRHAVDVDGEWFRPRQLDPVADVAQERREGAVRADEDTRSTVAHLERAVLVVHREMGIEL